MAKAEVAARCGMRRVDAVRVFVGDGGVRAVAEGVRHRLPAQTAVPLSWARELAEAGVPLFVVRDGRR